MQLGYPAPVGTPAQRFHVYYRDFAFYGVTYPENVQTLATSPVPLGTASAYIEVENDFAGFPPNDVDVTGQEEIRAGALMVTQAHEFMHACQFNINVYQSGWLFESHATWAEDAVYDQVNDWHWYIPFFLSTPDLQLFSRYVYGSAFFMNYLSETRGVQAPKQVWLAARTKTTPDAIRDAGFGGSWGTFGAFAPAEYLLGISDFTTDAPSRIPLPASPASGHAHQLSGERHGAGGHQAGSERRTLGPRRQRHRLRGRLGPGNPAGELRWAGRRRVAGLGRAHSGWGRHGLGRAADAERGEAGSTSISGFGNRWSRVTLVPTIADNVGVEVPFSYGATLQ